MRDIISPDRRIELIARPGHADALRDAGALQPIPPAAWRGADGSRYIGRAPPIRLNLPALPPLVVKTLRHGGLLGPLLGTTFLGSRRLRFALALGEHLASRGVATPEVSFGRICWRGRLRIACRLDLGTVEWHGSRSLLDYLGENDPGSLARQAVATWVGERRAVAAATGELVGALHAAGVKHADLNARNLLVAPPGPAEPGTRREVKLIDWEGSRRRDRLSPAARAANLERLLRSCAKHGLLERLQEERLPLRFLRAYAPDRTFRHDLWRSTRRRFLRRLPFHRLSWWLGSR